MRLLLDIPEKKADFILEVLQNFTFVKTVPFPSAHILEINELEESVKQVNLFKKRKAKLKNAKDFLRTL